MDKKMRVRKGSQLTLEGLVEQQRNQQMLDQLNRAYAEAPPTDEETRLLEAMRRQQRRLLEAEE